MAVAPLKKEKHWEMLGHFVCLSVCPGQFVSVQAKSGSELLLGVRSEPKTRLSLSVCPCPVQFVFTELQSGSTLLLGVHSKLIRSRTLQFGKKDATVLPTRTFPMLGPATVLHFSNVRPLRGRPSSAGVDRNRSTLSNVACPRCTAIKCRNQFSVLSVPHHAAQPQALNFCSF